MMFWRKRIKGVAVIHEGDVVLIETESNLSVEQAQSIKAHFERGGIKALVYGGMKLTGVKRAMP